MSIELPAKSRHHRDMTERLLNARIKTNKLENTTKSIICLMSSTKVQDCLTKLAFFSFGPAKTLSILQILVCPANDYSLSDSCPASVEKISRTLTPQDIRSFQLLWVEYILIKNAFYWFSCPSCNGVMKTK